MSTTRWRGRSGSRQKVSTESTEEGHLGRWPLQIVGGSGFGRRQLFAGEGFEFAADDVGREAGGEKRAVDRGEFLVGDFAFERTEFAFDALADDGGFIVGFGGFGESGADVAIRNAASAKIAGNAEFSLFADFGTLAGELFRVTRVVKLAGLLEASEDDLREKLGIGLPE